MFVECYCVSSKKPITHEKTELQTVTVLTLVCGFMSLVIGWCTMGSVKTKSKCSQFLDSYSSAIQYFQMLLLIKLLILVCE